MQSSGAIAKRRRTELSSSSSYIHSEKHPLASVRDSFNAVFINGDAIGEMMFYGQGAGICHGKRRCFDILHACQNPWKLLDVVNPIPSV